MKINIGGSLGGLRKLLRGPQGVYGITKLIVVNLISILPVSVNKKARITAEILEIL